MIGTELENMMGCYIEVEICVGVWRLDLSCECSVFIEARLFSV